MRVIIEKKLKYTIILLVILLISSILVNSLFEDNEQGHYIDRIIGLENNKTKSDSNDNLNFDKSDNAQLVYLEDVSELNKICPDKTLMKGIDETGEPICQRIGIRCGTPEFDSEDSCYIADYIED
ncbi:hypothetical protein KY334_02835 [Candidatus Woesearchaeota archaeon]|nr:hypothetical protein [Candidatus Woesearchaeota archaeon]